jgi:phospholipase A1
MKTWTAYATLLFAGAAALPAQELLVSLVPPAASVAPANPAKVTLLAVNPSRMDAAFDSPEVLHGRLYAGAQSWPVELQSDERADALVRPGEFAHRNYTFTLPPGATGRVVLEVAEGRSAPLRTAFVVSADANPAAAGGAVAAAAAPNPLGPSTPAAAQIRRTFLSHFSPHDPMYVIYGAKSPGVKIQFSFKYRLLDFGGDADITAQRTLQLGYTQRSLWDVGAVSSPFYDTSYMPSVFYESLASQVDRNRAGPLTWLGWQAGYEHESNGKASVDSRSQNTLFVRPAVLVGPLDGWHLIVLPKFWAYVGDLSNNRDVRDYRGYGELLVVLARNDGPALSYTGRAGRNFDHFTTQLGLTIPVRTKVLDFATYILVQYYGGYGESLLDYSKKTEAVRAGISLVR